MDANSRRSIPLALEPLEGSTAGGDQGAGLERGSRITAADEFLAQAAGEHQEGHIDQPLWDRTSAQFNGDEALLVAAYLRARATALKLQKRDERAEKRAQGAGSPSGASPPGLDLKSSQEPLSTKVAGAGQRSSSAKLKYAVAAVALSAAVVIVWSVASPRASEVVPQPKNAAATSGNVLAPPTPRASEAPAAANETRRANHGGPDATLGTKVQELKKAGNWNVLVLYASEWTRKEPNNATAWNELSIGYGKLRQLDDALEAATKAVQLAPEDPRNWRNLGYVNVAVERLPEARIAFGKALAVSPEDADALCGAALVAKLQGPSKDGDAIAARLKSSGGSCDGATDPAAAVVAGGSPARRTPSGGR